MRALRNTVSGCLLVASSASGQPVSEPWPRYCGAATHAIQRGVFPRLELLLVSGATARIAAAADLDGDGSTDALLEVTPAPSSTPSDCYGVLVLARHTASGWVGEVVECDTGPTTFTWAPPLIRGTSVTLVAIVNAYDRDDHTTTVLSQRLRRARAGVFAEQGEARVIAGAPAPAAPVPAPLPAGCRATLRASFHLRASEQVESTAGTSLPAGVVDVLSTASLLRAGARLYRVRTAGGATGFAFVRAEEFASGCAPP